MNTQNNIVSLLKKIFSLQSISTIISVIGLWFAYEAYNNDQSGEITAHYYGQEVGPNEGRVIVAILINCDSLELNDYMQCLPTLTNTSKHTAKGVNVTFSFGLPTDRDLPEMGATPHYTMHRKVDRIDFVYNKSELMPHEEVLSPLSYVRIKPVQSVVFRMEYSIEGMETRQDFRSAIMTAKFQTADGSLPQESEVLAEAIKSIAFPDSEHFDLWASNGTSQCNYRYINVTKTDLQQMINQGNANDETAVEPDNAQPKTEGSTEDAAMHKDGTQQANGFAAWAAEHKDLLHILGLEALVVFFIFLYEDKKLRWSNWAVCAVMTAVCVVFTWGFVEAILHFFPNL